MKHSTLCFPNCFTRTATATHIHKRRRMVLVSFIDLYQPQHKSIYSSSVRRCVLLFLFVVETFHFILVSTGNSRRRSKERANTIKNPPPTLKCITQAKSCLMRFTTKYFNSFPIPVLYFVLLLFFLFPSFFYNLPECLKTERKTWKKEE